MATVDKEADKLAFTFRPRPPSALIEPAETELVE